MDEQDIQVFLASARRYFDTLEPGTSLIVEPPFLRERVGPFLEYTGIIGISGRARGAICFTADGLLLTTVLSLLEDARTNEMAKRDLVGEIANTLSGNAREEFGKEFMISVPVVATGEKVQFRFPANTRNYVIPLNWSSHTAYLLVCLE